MPRALVSSSPTSRNQSSAWRFAALALVALPAHAEDCRLTLVAAHPVTGSRLVVDGPTLVVGDSGATSLLDVQNLPQIELRSKLNAAGVLDSSGGLLAVATSIGNKEVRLFDISSPASPIELAPYVPPNAKGFFHVAVHAGHVYGGVDGGVQIVRVEPGGLPTLVTTYSSASNYFVYFTARGGLLLGGQSSTWDLVSVSDPSAPTLMSTLWSASCNGTAVPTLQEGLAVVGAYSSYCGYASVYDISTPTNPTMVSGIFGTPFKTHHALVKGLLAAPMQDAGYFPKVTVYQLTSPTATPVAAIETKPGLRIAADAEHLYTLQGTDGLRVYSVDPCYANCDCNATALNIDDFICFQTHFALADPYADCDADGSLTIDDFVCFQAAYALGC